MSYDLVEVVVSVVEVSRKLELWSVLRQTWLLAVVNNQIISQRPSVAVRE